jgi:hypothetical protein
MKIGFERVSQQNPLGTELCCMFTQSYPKHISVVTIQTIRFEVTAIPGRKDLKAHLIVSLFAQRTQSILLLL